jgi:hypothetical protein
MMQSLKTVVLLAALVAIPATAGEEIKEMSMATDVGEVVLTLEPCPLNPNYGFIYLAYATEKGEPNHMGCWQDTEPLNGRESHILNIWFPEVNAVASYNKKLFKPRTKV